MSPTESGPVIESPRQSPALKDVDVLSTLGVTEIQRLLEIFDEEVQSIYPFIDVKELSDKVPSILQSSSPCEPQTGNNLKDVQMVKLAVASSVAIEAQGQNNISKRLIDEVEPVICRVSGKAFIDLQELQLMIMLVSRFRIAQILPPRLTNILTEYLLVSLRRRITCLEIYWYGRA